MFRSDVNYYISDMCRIFLPDAPECGFLIKRGVGGPEDLCLCGLKKLKKLASAMQPLKL